MAEKRSENDHLAEAREKIMEALTPHVVFDGWTPSAIAEAAMEVGVDSGLAKLAFPRGGIDAALYFHRRADRQLVEILEKTDLASMSIRGKITFAVRKRLELVEGDREAVRRAVSLFALPIYAPEGARALWETADAIWTGIGDHSDDYNWYTKRATLSAVYSAVALFWLGDQSDGCAATWAFLDRRIEDVMRFEKFKGQMRKNPLAKAFMEGPGRIFDAIKPPGRDVSTGTPVGLPGWRRPKFPR